MPPILAQLDTMYTKYALVQVDECLLNITSHGPNHLLPLYRNDNLIGKDKLLK